MTNTMVEPQSFLQVVIFNLLCNTAAGNHNHSSSSIKGRSKFAFATLFYLRRLVIRKLDSPVIRAAPSWFGTPASCVVELCKTPRRDAATVEAARIDGHETANNWKSVN